MRLRLFAIALPVFFAIDMLWLGVIASDFYRGQLGPMLREDPNWWAAIAFYVLFIAGIVHFVLIPAIERKSLRYAAFSGAAFGLVTYATYDLTNLALMPDWPLLMTVVDLIWGAVLTSLVSTITFLLARRYTGAIR